MGYNSDLTGSLKLNNFSKELEEVLTNSEIEYEYTNGILSIFDFSCRHYSETMEPIYNLLAVNGAEGDLKDVGEDDEIVYIYFGNKQWDYVHLKKPDNFLLNPPKKEVICTKRVKIIYSDSTEELEDLTNGFLVDLKDPNPEIKVTETNTTFTVWIIYNDYTEIKEGK